MSLSWIWLPGKYVGPFRFGDDAERVIEEFHLVKLEPDSEIAYWETYGIPDYESRVGVEHGKIADVLCCDSLVYQGVDLLGLSLDEARSLLGEEDELKKNTGPWDALYYNEMGLTLWVSDGVVDTATCEVPVLEDEDGTGEK